MEMTQEDFEERAQRVEDGEGSDEDQRLVKHYYREGFERGGSAPAGAVRNPFADDDEDGELVDYSKMTKRELVAELDRRTDLDGNAVEFDRQARNEVLIEQLRTNDQLHAEA